MKLEIVAAVNDEVTLSNNLAVSPLVRQGEAKLHIEKKHPSASSAYLAGLHKCTADIIVFAHQDVYIPAGWGSLLKQAINQLEDNGQEWAVLGVFGIDQKQQYHGRVWSSGLNQELCYPIATPQPIESIDELLIVLNRRSGITFDADLPSFHLYGTDIVQTALQQKKGAFAFHGPVIHNSNPVLQLDKSYRRAYRFMSKKWAHNLPIQTCIVPITKNGGPLYLSILKRLKKSLLKNKITTGRLPAPTLIAKKLQYE